MFMRGYEDSEDRDIRKIEKFAIAMAIIFLFVVIVVVMFIEGSAQDTNSLFNFNIDFTQGTQILNDLANMGNTLRTLPSATHP